MSPSDLIDGYLAEQHMMQLATLAGDQPWCCSLYYVYDKDRNLYWASLPTRRHSQEIAAHNKVAAAIPIKHVNGQKVVGIQVEGTAEMLPPSPSLRRMTELYAQKFSRDNHWVEDFIAGNTLHRLYKLTPTSIILFDEQHFADDPRKVLVI